MIRGFLSTVMLMAAMMFAFEPVLAKPQNVRSGSKSSVNRAAPKAKPANMSKGKGGGGHNATKAGNRPSANNRANNNNNRNTNVRGGNNNIGNTVVVAPGRRPPPPPPRGYGGGGYYYGDNDNWDNDDNDFLEFVGKAAVVTAGVAVVGTILKDEPKNSDGSECQQTISNGTPYMNCNGTWYQPVQMGNDVNYQTVNAPR